MHILYIIWAVHDVVFPAFIFIDHTRLRRERAVDETVIYTSYISAPGPASRRPRPSDGAQRPRIKLVKNGKLVNWRTADDSAVQPQSR